MSEKLKIGAVIYAPQVTVIWGIIADFFEKEGFPIEPVYFKDYKGQVDALLNNEIDVAWNSPLAWLDETKFNAFTETLFKMDYNNPEHKEMMDLEGLKHWVAGRTKGFAQLQAANEYLKFF